MAMEQKMSELETAEKLDDSERYRCIHAAKWCEYGQKTDDEVVKFMLYWVAFNWLYNDDHYRPPKPNGEVLSEREIIINFVKKEYTKLINYDPFKAPEGKFFLRRGPVKDQRNGVSQSKDYKKIKSRDSYVRVEGMFMTLYTVRCNLFHGNKEYNERSDSAVVCAAAKIIGEYLKTVLDVEADT